MKQQLEENAANATNGGVRGEQSMTYKTGDDKA